MRKLLILLCFIPLLLQGQGINVMHTALKPTTSGGGGESLGAEMLTDGTYDNGGTYWTTCGGTDVTHTDKANYDGGSHNDCTGQLVGNMVSAVETNTDYRLTFDLGDVATTVELTIKDTSGGVVYVTANDYANGSQLIDFTSPGSLGNNGFIIWITATSDAFYIDNVSLKERL